MEKRTFLKTSLWLLAGTSAWLQACKPGAKTAAAATVPQLPAPTTRRSTPFALDALPYETAALEPHIDKMTMEIHHGKHHAAYVNNLNDGVKGTVYADYQLEDILLRIKAGDGDKKIRNNAGGHWNHTFFWKSMTPKGGGLPSGALATAINAKFGSFDKFKEEWSNAAKGVFGSGWVWLCIGKDKGLFISTTPNQDNPLMANIVTQAGTPILGFDVWEHAYYLKHQNRRPDYIAAFYNVINWSEVQARYDKAMF
jgi:superoxide dismutase, Fe-Mn family